MALDGHSGGGGCVFTLPCFDTRYFVARLSYRWVSPFLEENETGGKMASRYLPITYLYNLKVPT